MGRIRRFVIRLPSHFYAFRVALLAISLLYNYFYKFEQICSQFDFAKLGSTTPWRTRVESISDANVAAKAERYVDQMKKKAALYRTGTI